MKKVKLLSAAIKWTAERTAIRTAEESQVEFEREG